MKKTYEVPPENQADYDEGFRIAKETDDFLNDPPGKTKEEIVARLAKQIGFLDGLAELEKEKRK